MAKTTIILNVSEVSAAVDDFLKRRFRKTTTGELRWKIDPAYQSADPRENKSAATFEGVECDVVDDPTMPQP